MNGKDLLVGMSFINGKYIEEAEKGVMAAKEQQPAGKKLNKTLLIAAVIALMALLVGCTVAYVMGLQDMKFGEHSFVSHNSEEEGLAETQTVNLLSLQGYTGSAPVLAMQEWYAFLESYDPDGTLSAANDNNASNIPSPYWDSYSCYTWEMVDKLDEIMEKYDLNLLHEEVPLQYYETPIVLEALKIPGFFREGDSVTIDYGSGYFYQEGTFSVDLWMTLSGDNSLNGYSNLISLRYTLMDYFDPAYFSVGNVESYEQWNYRTADGTEVLLALGDGWARIIAELDEAFYHIGLEANYKASSGETVSLTKDDLEELANLFDYTIRPQAADMGEVENLLLEADANHAAELAAANEKKYNSGYAFYAEYMVQFYEEKWPDIAQQLNYALYDINGDGVEEMIVFTGKTIKIIQAILSMKDGESYKYFDASMLPAMPVVYICEGNVIEIYDYSTGSHYYFNAGEDGASFAVGLYKNRDNTWGRFSDIPNPDPAQRNPENITEEEANEIINSYVRIELDTKPLSEFKMK